MFNKGDGWVGIVGLILFVVLAYDILKQWNGSVGILNAGFTGSVNTIKALQGR